MMSLLIKLVEENNLNQVKDLVNKGSDINEIDKFGYSALHIAVSKGWTSIAVFLIGSGIDLNVRDKSGQTILHYTALYNQIDIAQLALESGGDLSIEDSFGNQPLWTAVFNDKGRGERVGLIKLYLQNGANPNHKNNVGQSPRDILLRRGDNDLLSLM